MSRTTPQIPGVADQTAKGRDDTGDSISIEINGVRGKATTTVDVQRYWSLSLSTGSAAFGRNDQL